MTTPHVSIVDALHARVAEATGNAILTGQQQATLTLTTGEVVELLDHLATLNRRNTNLSREYRIADNTAEQRAETIVAMMLAGKDALAALHRIRATLDHPAPHHDAQTRRCATIARVAAEQLAAVIPKPRSEGAAP